MPLEGELYFICSDIVHHHIFSADISKAHQAFAIVKLWCPYCGIESCYDKEAMKPIPYYNKDNGK